MDSLYGWTVTAISTGAGAYIDLVKKRVMGQGINIWDSVAIINFFGFFYILLACIVFNSFPKSLDMNIFAGIISTSIIKIIAQACYFMSVKLSPLSISIPFLSWNSLFLLVSGYFYLNEVPSYFGIAGCLLILVGAYIKSFDSLGLDTNKINYQRFKFMGINFKLSGSFYMIIVCILWTYTTTQEKYLMVNMNLTPSFLLMMQRIFMSLPLIIFRFFVANEVFKTTLIQNFKGLTIVSFMENISTGFHFKGMELLYVSYVTAFKRAGNIIISTFLGYKYLGEKISRACLISNLAMSIGIVFILCGK